MTTSKRWLLPAGIEELLPEQAGPLEELRRALLDLYAGWGYALIMPPMIEYLDSLLTGMGSDLDLQTFKITDQLSGRLMGIRADITPQVARIDANRMREAGVNRLCYSGEVLHTRPDGFAGTRSPLLVGAELYGHPGIESDTEILSLMLATLQMVGLQQVQVDVGHVGVYGGVAAYAGLDHEQEQLLFEALQRKARADIDQLLSDWPIAAEARRMLSSLMDLNGDVHILVRARELLSAAGDGVTAALDAMQDLASGLEARMPGTSLYFDLSELRGYHFHTGLVFAAFIPGHGQEVARGGRYDNIGQVFGRARPATGFSADLKTLARLAGVAPRVHARGILAPWANDRDLEDRIAELRDQGERVINALPGDDSPAAALGCDRELVDDGTGWVLRPVEK